MRHDCCRPGLRQHWTALPLEQHSGWAEVPDGEEGEGDGEDRLCYMGELTLFCKDMWHERYERIVAIPNVNVGYDEEEEGTKGETGVWADGEWMERDGDERGVE